MAEIKLRIQTNFEEAAKELERFGTVSEAERKRIEKFIGGFESKKIQEFIDKANRMGASVSAVQGPIDGATARQKALQREISRLINKGLKPQDESLKKLQKEYTAASAEVERYNKKLEQEHVQEFIDKSNHMRASVAALKSPIEGLTEKQKALQQEISRLINKGLKPQDESLKKLQKEYIATGAEVEHYNKKLERQKFWREQLATGSRFARRSLLGLAAGFVGLGAAAVKAAGGTEQATAGFTPMLGSVGKAEKLVDALNKTAATTPFQFAGIAGIAKQLLPTMNGNIEKTVKTFRMLGDTAGGNMQKLDSVARGYQKAMLKGKVDVEALNMIAEAGVPIYDQLAKSMGVSTAQMLEMSSKGQITSERLTEAFEMMTSEGGLFFNGMEIASATMVGKLSTLKDNVAAVAKVFGKQLLPYVKDVIDRLISGAKQVQEFAGDTEKLQALLANLIPVIAGVGSALAGLLIIGKVSALIAAFKNFGRMATPIGLVVVAIGALVAAGSAVYTHWDAITTWFHETITVLQARFAVLCIKTKSFFIVAFNAIQMTVLDLVDVIYGKLFRAIGQLLQKLKELPIVGKLLGKVGDGANFLGDALGKLRLRAHESTTAAQEDAQVRIRLAEKTRDATIASIKKTHEDSNKAMEEHSEKAAQEAEKQQDAITKAQQKGIAERLAVLNNAEAVRQQKRLAAFKQFFDSRMQQENVQDNVHGNERIAFLQKELERIKALETLSADEKVAAEKTVTAMIAQEKKEQAKAEREALNQRIAGVQKYANSAIQAAQQVAQVFQNISQQEIMDLQAETEEKVAQIDARKERELTALEERNAQGLLTHQEYEKEKKAIEQEATREKQKLQDELEKKRKKARHEAAVAQKAVAVFQTATDTAIAIAKAIASAPFPLNLPAISYATVQGGIQMAAAASAPIPPMQTGGRFVVPDAGIMREDSVGLRVNPGETVDVTPRGEDPARALSIVVQLDSRVILETVQEGFDSGQLVINGANIC